MGRLSAIKVQLELELELGTRTLLLTEVSICNNMNHRCRQMHKIINLY